MQNVGWAAAAVLFLGGVFWVLGYICEQVPELCNKLIIAIASVREVRTALRDGNDGAAERPQEQLQETSTAR